MFTAEGQTTTTTTKIKTRPATCPRVGLRMECTPSPRDIELANSGVSYTAIPLHRYQPAVPRGIVRGSNSLIALC